MVLKIHLFLQVRIEVPSLVRTLNASPEATKLYKQCSVYILNVYAKVVTDATAGSGSQKISKITSHVSISMNARRATEAVSIFAQTPLEALFAHAEMGSGLPGTLSHILIQLALPNAVLDNC